MGVNKLKSFISVTGKTCIDWLESNLILRLLEISEILVIFLSKNSDSRGLEDVTN